MIASKIREFLSKELDINVALERHDKLTKPFILIEQIGSSTSNKIPSKTYSFQSYGKDLLETMTTNDLLIQAFEKLTTLDEIVSVNLNSDYNFTDTSTKEYRYQAVVDIKHY